MLRSFLSLFLLVQTSPIRDGALLVGFAGALPAITTDKPTATFWIPAEAFYLKNRRGFLVLQKQKKSQGLMTSALSYSTERYFFSSIPQLCINPNTFLS
jgi:hypothetical protein